MDLDNFGPVEAEATIAGSGPRNPAPNTGAPRPEGLVIARFVDVLFQRAPRGMVVLQAIHKTGARLQGAEDLDRATISCAPSRLFGLDELNDLVDLAVKWNSAPGVAVFTSAGLRREDLIRNSPGAEADVTAATAIKADLDAEHALPHALELLQTLNLSPNIAHRTATHPFERGHLWWLLEEPEPDLARVRAVEQALKRMLNGTRSPTLVA